MRLSVVIPAHTYPPVLKLTIGSLIRSLPPEYDLNIHVGIHSNYSDYTRDFSIFEELRGLAQVHLVREIDWKLNNECVYRYSTMHATSLENLLDHVRYYDFDYLLVLDHDIFSKADFVSECLKLHPGADLIGALFDDLDVLSRFRTEAGRDLYCLPKISIWHLLVSRRLFEEIARTPRMIYPRIVEGEEIGSYLGCYGNPEPLPVFVDTFAEVLHRCKFSKSGEFKVGILPSEKLGAWTRHFYGSSFNYGHRTLGSHYPDHIREIAGIYEKEFPNGLSRLPN